MDKQLLKNKYEKYILITLVSLFMIFSLNNIYTSGYYISIPILHEFSFLNYAFVVIILLGFISLLVLKNYKKLLINVIFLLISFFVLSSFDQFTTGCDSFSINSLLIPVLFCPYLFFIFKDYTKIRKIMFSIFGFLFVIIIIIKFGLSGVCEETPHPWEERGAIPCVPRPEIGLYCE